MAHLSRRLRLGDAVFVGLSAMIGAGVFAAFAPAAQAAGGALLVGLGIAAVVAFCNAASTAQLAARHPEAGGAYAYGRHVLGPWWGFAAGWSFVIGKTASCAAMALTFAAYAVPAEWSRPVAAAAVVVLVGLNCVGVTRTAAVARVLVLGVLAVLAVVLLSGVAGPTAGGGLGAAGFAGAGGGGGLADPGGAMSGGGFTAAAGVVGGGVADAVGGLADADGAAAGGLADAGGAGAGGLGVYGVLQAAGLLFFACAGYARVATLGEEVRDPARTIPRAIGIAFGVAIVVYALVAVVALAALGGAGLAGADDPLAAVVAANGWAWAVPLVGIGAALASLGALLALIAGVGRTTFAMARGGDLPRMLDHVHPRFATPVRAELAVGAVVLALVLTLDLRGAIGFSSFGVLLYYSVANLAAWRQPRAERRYGRALSAIGAVGCVVLAATLPPLAVVVGAGVVALGLVGRVLVRRRAAHTRTH